MFYSSKLALLYRTSDELKRIRGRGRGEGGRESVNYVDSDGKEVGRGGKEGLDP